MYAVYKQTHPPTGVEHCVYCNFFSQQERNLVITAVNQIHVFRLNLEAENGGDETNIETLDQAKMKLECLATYSLFGNVMSMQAVTLAGAQRDALLFSFSDAKLSVVEYDPGTHDLQTTSLHYFEDPKLKDFCTPFSIPTLRVDPDGRCAAMLIYGTKLVILPFQREVYSDDVDSMIGGGGGGSSRSPILNSYIIDLRSFDEKILNVLDFQFLHGYYEPTVFILFEPYPTWAGRVAVRTDTCSIVAISLNIQEKVHPVIWSLSNLPFDCLQCVPVPKPIGGVLVFAVNILLYLNQSVPPYGVALNSIAETTTVFPLRLQEGVRITLDSAQAAFISYDKLVLSLKGGELYVLTLMVDGMRSVRSFNFDKSAASVLTTCMCLCEDGYLFLGSRLGNSLLLKYTEKDSGEGKQEADKRTGEPAVKKKKLDTQSDMASDVSQIENLDELEVYGASENPSGTTITSYVFEVCDNIWNIAPCGKIVMGEPAFLSEEFSNSSNLDLELVTTSGYGKNGALSVLQRSIRPQVVTTFELAGCVDMWTVQGQLSEEANTSSNKSLMHQKSSETDDQSGEESKPTEVEGGHSFLILSKSDSSMILQTGQEIMELDHSGFSTQTPTIYAGNIGDGKYIIQVSPTGVRLLDGVNQLQHIPMDTGCPIVHCSVTDPYIFLLMEDGQILMLTLQADGSSVGIRLIIKKPQFVMKPRVVVMTAYKDVSGIFTTTAKQEEVKETATDNKSSSKASMDKVFSMDQSTIDDEDELLYGESETSVFGSSFNTSGVEENKPTSSSFAKKRQQAKPTYWAVVYRENGALEILSVPDFKTCYYVKHFPAGQKVLVDSLHETVLGSRSSVASTSGEKQDKTMFVGDISAVKEILVVGLGYQKARPYLLARVEEDLLLYEAFQYYQTQTENHLKLRFKKVQHNLILREKKARSKKKDGDIIEITPAETRSRLFRYFEDISGYSGVFICGAYPHWLFMTARGSLRIHPMSLDGPVSCFTPFHNVNCPKGFLYFNKQGELRISVLPTHLTYDAPWPIRKVPLRCTPHSVSYHMESKTYSVVVSNPEICNKLPKTDTEDKVVEAAERDERFVYPILPRFSCQLYSSTSWEVVPNTKIECEDFEHITSLKYCMLKSEGTISGFKGHMAIGTNYAHGEEIVSRGRIIIFDVIEVVPEPGQPLTKHKIKVIYDKEQKGPVTALSDVNGYLVSAIGQKLFLWQLRNDDLVGVAFIDTHIYIHSITSVKNLILVGDLIKSVTVYRYQQEQKVLSFVSRDIKPMETYAVDFMVDNSQLAFIASDRLKNIFLFSYQPEIRESHGGQRLLRKADFNVGSHINTMFRIRCKLSDHTDGKMSELLEKRQITYFATLDGSLGYVLPISEKVYRRLLMLQNALATQIPHTAGLNPKVYRAMKYSGPDLSNPHKNILDGELIWKYLHLSQNEKSEIAKRIGTTIDQLVDDMMEVERITAHF